MLKDVKIVQQTRQGCFAVDLEDTDHGIKRISFDCDPENTEMFNQMVAACYAQWMLEFEIAEPARIEPDLEAIRAKCDSFKQQFQDEIAAEKARRNPAPPVLMPAAPVFFPDPVQEPAAEPEEKPDAGKE